MSNLIHLRRKDTGSPWGFRLHGGSETNQPLTIYKVIPGSLSWRAGLRPGDRILQIMEMPTEHSTMARAKGEILRAGNELDFIINRMTCPEPSQLPPPVVAPPKEERQVYPNPPAAMKIHSRSFRVLQTQLGNDT